MSDLKLGQCVLATETNLNGAFEHHRAEDGHVMALLFIGEYDPNVRQDIIPDEILNELGWVHTGHKEAEEDAEIQELYEDNVNKLTAQIEVLRGEKGAINALKELGWQVSVMPFIGDADLEESDFGDERVPVAVCKRLGEMNPPRISGAQQEALFRECFEFTRYAAAIFFGAIDRADGYGGHRTTAEYCDGLREQILALQPKLIEAGNIKCDGPVVKL